MSSNPPAFEPKETRRRPIVESDETPRTPSRSTPEAGDLPPSIPPAGAPRRHSVMGNGDAEAAPRRLEAKAAPVEQRNVTPRSYAPRATKPTAVPRSTKTPVKTPPPVRPSTKRRKKLPLVTAVLAVFILGWPVFLFAYTNAHLQRVDALVAGTSSPGTTYLIAGSDGRSDGAIEDGVEGERADSILMVHVAPNGQSTMLSLPRDTYVDIPGEGWSKLNSAFSWGGPALLVETVQNLTGVAIDHYVQLNMGGVGMLVDAVGGVNLCMDMDVEDAYSGLSWTAGCKDVQGNEALAYARMRYEDPRGDIGRAERQREIISKVTKKALSIGTFINPVQQIRLSNAGTEALIVDEKMSLFDIGKLVLAFRNSTSKGFMGTPPIASLSEMTAAGAVVLLDEDRTSDFFQKLAEGTLTEADFDVQ